MNRLKEIKTQLKELSERLPEVETRKERREITDQVSKLMEEKILIESDNKKD